MFEGNNEAVTKDENNTWLWVVAMIPLLYHKRSISTFSEAVHTSSRDGRISQTEQHGYIL